MAKFSISDINCYLQCKRKWELSSAHRHNLEPIQKNTNLWFGSAMHKGLEDYYANSGANGGDKLFLLEGFKDYIDKELEEEYRQTDEFLKLEELGRAMLAHYYKYAKKYDHDYFNKFIETEQKFEIPIIGTNHTYVGTIDGIVEDSWGRRWLMEHKTAAKIQTSHLGLDMQVAAYLYAAQELFGYELEGVVYNSLLKDTPTQPRVLKNGSLSKAKNQKVTYDSYKLALVDHYGSEKDVPWDDYQEYLDSLKTKSNPYFDRQRVRKTSYEIDDMGQRIGLIVKEMDSNPTIYPSPDRMCSYMCDFQGVCMEMNAGADYQYLLDTLYQNRAKRY